MTVTMQCIKQPLSLTYLRRYARQLGNRKHSNRRTLWVLTCIGRRRVMFVGSRELAIFYERHHEIFQWILTIYLVNFQWTR